MGPGRFVDSQGLFSAPEFASAVAWSEDNVLACAQGSSVSLLHPGALDGPRAYTSPIQPGEWSLDQGPHAPPGTLAQDLAAIRAQAYASQWPALARSPSVRSVAWSGRGLAPQGGCALCVVTCDHQVKVFFPPVHHTSEWSDCRDLTGDIVEASQRVAPGTEQEWRPLQGGLVDSQSAPGQRSAAHGGGPTAAGNSPGAGDQEVEVLRLRGGARPEAGTDPNPDAKPGVPAAKRPRKAPHPSRAAGSDEGAAGAKSPESRTAGAAQGPSRGGPLVPPSAASAALLAAAAAAAPGLPAKEARAALLDAAVRAFLAQRGELPAPERPRYPTPSSHLKGADLGLLNGVLARLADVHGTALDHAGLTRAALALELRRALRLAWDRVRDRPRRAGVEGGPEEGGGDGGGGDTAASVDRSPQESTAPQVGARSRVRGGRGSHRSYEAEASSSSGEDPPSSPSSDGGPPSPSPSTSSLDGEAGGPRGRRAAARRGRGAGAAGRGVGAAPPSPATPGDYVVPAGFTWRQLPAVNVSSGVLAARRSIIVAAVRRFLALREELPASQRPSYASRREHLRGADVRLAGRVTAEFATAFPRLLQQLGYDAGLFASVWLNRLRRGWDRVDGTLEAGLGVLEGPVPGGGAKSPASEGAWAGEGPALAVRDAGWESGRREREGTPGSGADEGASAGSRRARRLDREARDDDLSDPGIGASGGHAGATPGRKAARGVWCGPGVSAEAWRAGADARSCLCTAFSPGPAGNAAAGAFPDTPRFHSWLAVGARGGRVWLWKARPPERGPSLDATAAARPGEAGASLRLVRGLALGASWVTALAFLPHGGEGAHGAAGPRSSQTLAAGMSCGRVRLLTLDGDGGLLAQRCVLPPDLSPVTCLAAAAGCVAAGKADGRLHVWAAPLREAVVCGSQVAVQGPGDDAVEDLRASTERDTVGCPAAAHGHRPATGVAWGHRGMDPGALPLLVSAGLGGELCAWRVERGVHEVTLAPAPALSPAGRAKDAGWGCLGVAASGSGLLIATLRHARHPATELVKQLQVHQRVVQSVVRLYCLPDPDQRDLQQAARAWVARGAGAGGAMPLPSALWDVLCALRQPTETDGEDPPARLLSWLSAGAGEAHGQGAALRCAVAALRVLSGREPGAGAAAMELDLLLRRARGALTAALAGDGRGATANCPVEDEATEAVLGRVAAWVLASAGESGVDEELLGLAAAVPQRNELDASAPLAGGMEGATTALKTLKDGSTVVVARCPLTLLPLETSRTWQCCVCERRYARWEASGCVLCAGALGPLRGSLCLNVPCL